MILTIAISVAIGLLLARIFPALAKYIAIVVSLTIFFVLMEGRWLTIGPPLGVMIWYTALIGIVKELPANLFRRVPRLAALIKPTSGDVSFTGQVALFGLAVATAPVVALILFAVGWLFAKMIEP